MIGKTISHYTVLEKLGEGGMGEVYRARDLKLGRQVAIKLLPRHLGDDAAAKERFMREAQAASALDHPNICAIYEIDETDEGSIFMVMACYEGETVGEKIARGPLGIAEAIDIASGVASGLTSAHERGIVHRDIKPANVMVTTDGAVKIMDFGIAKLAGQSKVTREGVPIGTAAYMSPEQARGAAVDHRTDIWSLGVLLHETITGERPFKGEFDQAVLYAIVNEEPKPPSAVRRGVPPELDRLVMKAIEKSPESRYGSAGELLSALTALGKTLEQTASDGRDGAGGPRDGGAARLPSIAVLPFRDMSPEKDQEYFCEGMAEELINVLVQIEGLQVAARTSSFQFKGKNMDVREIGRQLRVQNVLEGSVRKAGDRLRITAQLVKVDDGYHLFSEKYDRTIDDVFAIQDEISLAIVDRMKVRLLESDKSKMVKRHTENQEAYNLYLKGRFFWNRREQGQLERGIECFRKAIEIDPDYARAYTGIADCLLSLGWFDFLPPADAYGRAKDAALRALAMDPALAEAHASLGWALQLYDWDWAGAEREFKRSIELNPNYATARHFYSMFLSGMGRHEEAIRERLCADELEPLVSTIKVCIGLCYYWAREYDRAIEETERAIAFDPHFFIGHMILGLCFVAKTKYREADEALRRADDLSGGNSTLVAGMRGIFYAAGGEREKAVEILNGLLERRKEGYASAFLIASIYANLGDLDGAFAWLDTAYDERDHWLCYLNVFQHPVEVIAADPRFRALVRRLGLGDPP